LWTAKTQPAFEPLPSGHHRRADRAASEAIYRPYPCAIRPAHSTASLLEIFFRIANHGGQQEAAIGDRASYRALKPDFSDFPINASGYCAQRLVDLKTPITAGTPQPQLHFAKAQLHVGRGTAGKRGV